MSLLTGFDQPKRNRSSRGFSLVELLIIVAIVLVIISVTIPNFLRSKRRANESSAVANLRTISRAEVVYNTTYGIGFAPSLVALAGNPAVPNAAEAGLIDSVLGAGTKNGYQYFYNVIYSAANGHVLFYSVTADPLVPGTSGDRHFYTDQTNVIRFDSTVPASATDSPIE